MLIARGKVRNGNERIIFMNVEQYFKNLNVPSNSIDVVLDTDAYNEVDDQFAIAYLVKSREKLNTCAVYAAPFSFPGEEIDNPKLGMEKSYDEIVTTLKLAGRSDLLNSVYYGSENYLKDENTPQISAAAEDLAKRAMNYSPEKPLYVVAIGAITNVASALLLNPEIAERIVIVWLGGHSYTWHDTYEFNMYQDVAAARVVMQGTAPFVQLPCMGVVSGFSVSWAELEKYLKGKNTLCDFLVGRVADKLGKLKDTESASRVIWDVTAVAWLLNDDDRFMLSDIVHAPTPEYSYNYSFAGSNRFIRTVYHIKRDELATDMFKKLAEA